jgi:tRNA-dihydrouridine synthase B
LREPARVDAILAALRETISIKFTVKTRLGFDTPANFAKLLEIFARHDLDMLTVHARTVKEMYWSEVHYDYIAEAARAVSCPVIANGNIYSAQTAEAVLKQTGARGLMIGRGAIRNPWMFNQIRTHLRGEPVIYPTGLEVLDYVRRLYEALRSPEYRESAHVQMLKKYMNFIGVGVDGSGDFLHRMRRATTDKEFWEICSDHLNHSNPLPLEPLTASGIRVETPMPASV